MASSGDATGRLNVSPSNHAILYRDNRFHCRACCPRRRPMTAWESLRLSPFQKWRKYGRVPYKFLIGLWMVFLTSFQVSMFISSRTPYLRSQAQNWEHLLTMKGTDSVVPLTTTTTSFQIYRATTLKESILNHVNTYYSIQNISVDHYDYNTDELGRPMPLTLTYASYKQGMDIFNESVVFEDDLLFSSTFINQSFAGPFDNTGISLATYVRPLHSITVSFDIRNFDIRGQARICYKWHVSTTYSFDTRGGLTMRYAVVVILIGSMSNIKSDPWYQRAAAGEIILSVIIIAFSSLSHVLHIKALIRSFRMYRIAKRRHNQLLGATSIGRTGSSDSPAPIRWDQLTCQQKMRFFNLWFIVSSIGSTCNFLGAFFVIHYQTSREYDDSIARFLCGTGCLMAWTSLCQYFESTSAYYVLFLTLKKGIPRVGRFLAGVMPIFLGYALFGVAFFSDSSVKFASVDQASVTLFALLNGDAIHDTFDELFSSHAVISRIYLYSFISLFIYCCLNITIAIIEDSFNACRDYSLQKERDRRDVDPLDLLDLPPVTDSPLITQPRRSATDVTTNQLRLPLLTTSYEVSDSSRQCIPCDVRSELIRTLQIDVEAEMNAALRKLEGLGNKKFRPPHANDIVCDFSDCILCGFKRAGEAAINTLHASICDVLSVASETGDYSSGDETKRRAPRKNGTTELGQLSAD